MGRRGNESGDGANNDALAGWKGRDDTNRTLNDEGANHHGEGLLAVPPKHPAAHWITGGLHATDVVCPMYASVDSTEEWATTKTAYPRPLILCEYSNAIGYSTGELADSFPAVLTHAPLQVDTRCAWVDTGVP